MPESPRKSNHENSFEPAGQEVRKQRFQALAEQHDLLDTEMGKLIAEEWSLIAKNGEDEADFLRLQEINRREIEIIEMQKEIIEGMARLSGSPGQ
jgi:hypothetical protein